MPQNQPSPLTISLVGSASLIALLLLGLYLGEFVLLLTAPSTKSESLTAQRQHIERSFPAVTPQIILLRNQLQGLSAGPNELVPLGGVSHANTVFCQESGEMIVYRSDRYGFRNSDEQWDKPVDVVAIGDSYTQGACVRDNDHFVGQLRERYANVLNLGSFGNGPYSNLAVISEYALKIRPKLILWFYVANDMAIDMNLEQGNRLLPQYLNPAFSQNLVERQSEIDAALEPFLELEWKRQQEEENHDGPNILTLGHVRRAINIGWRKWLRPSAPDLPAELDYDRQESISYQKHAIIVATAAQRARQQASEFIFVIVPDARMLRPIGGSVTSPEKHVDKLKRSLSSMGINVIDLFSPLAKMENPEELYSALNGYYGHFDSEGYRYVGQFLLSRLPKHTVQAPTNP